MIEAVLPVLQDETDAMNVVSHALTAAVVIVNWNGAEHLDECLTALRLQTLNTETEIIVIDNGSTDGSIEVLDRYGESVRVIRNPTNVGFAAGCNQGIAVARAEFIALLNNDAVVEPTWLEELVKAMRRAPDIGSCTSKVLWYYDHNVFDNAGHVVYADGLTRGRGRLQHDSGQFEREEDVFAFSGCAALLRRSMLEDIGLFDEEFFAYCEDADLAFRARLRGWRSLYCTDCHRLPQVLCLDRGVLATEGVACRAQSILARCEESPATTLAGELRLHAPALWLAGLRGLCWARRFRKIRAPAFARRAGDHPLARVWPGALRAAPSVTAAT